MIDALIKRVSVTYKCYEMYAHRGKKVQLLLFWDRSRNGAILLIIGIVYGVCRIVIKSVQPCVRETGGLTVNVGHKTQNENKQKPKKNVEG
jgi:hypothetical protein